MMALGSADNTGQRPWRRRVLAEGFGDFEGIGGELFVADSGLLVTGSVGVWIDWPPSGQVGDRARNLSW